MDAVQWLVAVMDSIIFAVLACLPLDDHQHLTDAKNGCGVPIDEVPRTELRGNYQTLLLRC